jgi:hypothetical protein
LNAGRGGRLRLWWMIAVLLLHTLVSIYDQVVSVQQCIDGLMAVLIIKNQF